MNNDQEYIVDAEISEEAAEIPADAEAVIDSERTFFFKLGQWSMMALAFLLPLWFLPVTFAQVDFNKTIMVSALTTFALLFYLFDAMMRGRISFTLSSVFILMALALASWLASALIAPTSSVSIWGVGAETTTVFSLLVFLVMSWLTMMLFGEGDELKKIIASFISGLVLFLLFVAISAFGFFAGLGGVFSARTFNPIGSWNTVSLSLGFLIMLIYPFLLWSEGKLRFLLYAVLAAALALMVVVNFAISWLFLGFFSLAMLSYAIWRRNANGMALVVSTVILVISLFAFFLHDSILAVTLESPVEVGVAHSTTLAIAKESLKENLFLGAGPANFGFLWDKFKPAGVNQTPFWGVRFVSGSSYLLTLLAEAGILGGILFLLLVLNIWYLGLRSLSLTGTRYQNMLSLSAFLAFSYTLLLWAFYSPSYALVAMGFLASGLLLASARSAGAVASYNFSLFTEGPFGLISSMLLVFVIIAGFGGLYLVGTRYASQVLYSSGVEIFNSSGNLDLAEKKIVLASQLDGRNDLYKRELSQLHMYRAQLALGDQATPRELLLSKFKDSLDKAIASAQSATRAAPLDFVNFRSFGKIYESLISLNTQGAADAALTQYDEAVKRSPKNPILYRDKAGIYIAQAASKGDVNMLKKAEEALVKATELKPDYTEAHFLLAQVYDAEGKLADAVARAEAVALLSPQDIGSLFQLGLLYYKSNRLADAEVLLSRAVALNDNYSNSRYFLGLIYDRAGRRSDALAQFEKIGALNPDNDEVKKILANLKANKPALAGIVPPESAPEKRSAPPVRDQGAERDSSLRTPPKPR